MDADRARQTYLTAIIYACFAGNFVAGVDMTQIARTARAAPRADRSSRALDLLLDGFVALAIDGAGTAAPLLQQAMEVFRGPDLTAQADVRWLGAACPAASVVWDDEKWHVLVSEYVGFVRKAGALTYLSSSLNGLAHALLLEGDLEAASSCIDEAVAINEVSGSRYASLGQCEFEVRAAEGLFQRHGVPTINTTECSIEEIASRIIDRKGIERRLRP